MSSRDLQKQVALPLEEKLSPLQVVKGKDKLEMVWSNIEKILDEFEEDLLKGKEELMFINNLSTNNDYFSWDIEAEKNNRISR